MSLSTMCRTFYDAGKNDNDIMVGTVDKLHGEEWLILILDLVLQCQKTVGFMKERRPLKVSLSRSMDMLLVGDVRAFARNKPQRSCQRRWYSSTKTSIAILRSLMPRKKNSKRIQQSDRLC